MDKVLHMVLYLRRTMMDSKKKKKKDHRIPPISEILLHSQFWSLKHNN